MEPFTNAVLICAAAKFDKVEYLQPKVEGEKQHANPVKGQISFGKDKKVVVFQDEKSQTLVTIPCEKIKSTVYEKTSKPG